MAGLRRLTLNGNILIGDEGAAAIARELAEDLWVKAVDLQRCGLSNVGGTALLQAVQSNRCLCVLDVRNNPLVDNSLVKDIITRVLMNTVNSSDTQYLWIKPPTSGNPVRNTRRASHRTSLMSKKASGSVPWRTAARAGLQNAATSARTRHDLQGAASVKVALESEEEEELEEVDQRGEEKISSGRYGRLKVALEECQLRLTEERNARMQANSRLVELELENARLRSQNASLSEAARSPGASVLLDDALLDSVEGSFSKFHSFLNLLCEAGLGQLASMAGIQQADLAVLGRPRPSSPQAAREEISLDLRSESLQEAAGSASPGVGSPHTEAQPGPTSSPAAPEEEPSSPSSLKSRRHAGSHGSGSHGSSSRSSASSRGYVEALHITSF
uniref:Uncharacterized protein n=2 Tax=Denticeps clupeoides TaxID=299321 RepID=A0AAY4BGY7_9TELE